MHEDVPVYAPAHPRGTQIINSYLSSPVSPDIYCNLTVEQQILPEVSGTLLWLVFATSLHHANSLSVAMQLKHRDC